jgi:hypothetical protein
MVHYVLSLEEIDETQVTVAGGMDGHLGELSQANYRSVVPFLNGVGPSIRWGERSSGIAGGFERRRARAGSIHSAGSAEREDERC